jgi:hypothetical protein
LVLKKIKNLNARLTLGEYRQKKNRRPKNLGGRAWLSKEDNAYQHQQYERRSRQLTTAAKQRNIFFHNEGKIGHNEFLFILHQQLCQS